MATTMTSLAIGHLDDDYIVVINNNNGIVLGDMRVSTFDTVDFAVFVSVSFSQPSQTIPPVSESFVHVREFLGLLIFLRFDKCVGLPDQRDER
ncbi:Hypothetical predicted protein [Octopus vulgaris]|uniref:Uncharacterized protein n=1 Tax=Octopus vulgaris TaxID=6645 RepID=A0AA36B104_OCTVU|nr:Hypothetical predicted protein [Octopus vulgaris]